MRFDVLTLFPEMFEPIKQSIIGKAEEKKLIDINLINIRDFSKDKHKKVDDTPYGGGAGMVIKPDVVYDAFNSIKSKNAKTIPARPPEIRASAQARNTQGITNRWKPNLFR